MHQENSVKQVQSTVTRRGVNTGYLQYTNLNVSYNNNIVKLLLNTKNISNIGNLHRSLTVLHICYVGARGGRSVFDMFLRRLGELAALLSNRGKLNCRSVLGSQLLANLRIVYRSWNVILSVNESFCR